MAHLILPSVSSHQTVQQGFTLVEISIVMIIIAMLTGAVIGGQQMINDVRYNEWKEQIQSYRVAVNTFYRRYNALPGDFTKATTEFTAVTTVNGNGDGVLSGTERTAAIQHLILAGLIKGDPTSSTRQPPTPVGGKLEAIESRSHDGKVDYSHKLRFFMIPHDFAVRLDQDLDDGQTGSGRITGWTTGSAVYVYVEL